MSMYILYYDDILIISSVNSPPWQKQISTKGI